MDFSTSITVGGQTVVLSVPRNTRAWRLANSVFIPLGAAPSQAWMLMTGAKIRALDANSTHSIEWSMIPVGAGSTTTLTFPGWRIIKAEKLLPGGTNDDNSLYLVELADSRRIALENSDTASITMNLRSFANSQDYLAGTSGGTWENLLSTLWTACGVLGSYPGLPAALSIDGVPESTWLIGLNAYRALNAVLEQLDCALCPDPFTTNYSIVQLGEAQPLDENTDRLQWNSEPIGGNVLAAANLNIYFTVHRKAYGQERDTELANNWVYSGAGAFITSNTNITGAIGTKPLWDDMPWVLNELGVQSNGASTALRAINRTLRYIVRNSVTAEHRIYSGLMASYVPGGQVRATLWRNWDDRNNPYGGTVTEFVCGNDLVTSFGAGNSDNSNGANGTAWFDRQLAAPERENYSPIELGRRGYGNATYPRLSNVVQVWHTGQNQPNVGDVVDPNADGFHRGRVRRWVNNSMVTLDDCWIRFVTDHDELNGQVSAEQGQFYGPGRLSGVTTSEGELLPVYLVSKGGGDELVFYELIEDQILKDGGAFYPTKAVLLEYDAASNTYSEADPPVLIYVWDHYPDECMFTGISGDPLSSGAGQMGDRGWAKFIKSAGETNLLDQNEDPLDETLDWYVIIFQSGPCHWVEFVTDEDLIRVEDEDHPNYYLPIACQFIDPFLYGHDKLINRFGEQLPPQVYIRQETYVRVLEGARGWAAYHDRERIYEVIQVDQVGLFGRATLADDMCDDGVQYTEFAIDTVYPFSQVPPSGQMNIVNPRLHQGRAQDEIKVMLRTELNIQGELSDTIVYDVVSVTKHKLDCVHDVYTDSEGRLWKNFTPETAQEVCRDDEDEEIQTVLCVIT